MIIENDKMWFVGEWISNRITN